MSKKNKERSGLKILAADAKARLKSGYHNKDLSNGSTKNYYDIVKGSFGMKETSEKEKIFYEKVKNILEEEGVTNPILRLVDQSYLDTLSYSSKQKYLLEISEKFNKIKAEIKNNDN